MSGIPDATPIELTAEERTERFDKDPVWDGRNNRATTPVKRTVRQAFGYSRTANAGGKLGDGRDLVPRPGSARQQTTCGPDQLGTGRRRADPGPSLEQHGTDFGLQSPDRGAQARLGQPQLGRSSCEAAHVRHHDQVPEPAQIQRHTRVIHDSDALYLTQLLDLSPVLTGLCLHV